MNVWKARYDDYLIVQCTMLYGLDPGLQKCFERHEAYEMFQQLKLVFQTHARVERYETSDKYFAYKMEENSSGSEHVLRMSGYYNHLNQVGVKLADKIVIDRVLQSLSPSYQNFVMNYNMQGIMKMIPELFAMQKSAKEEIKKEHQVLMVNKTTSFKKMGKGKEKELQEEWQASCCSCEEA